MNRMGRDRHQERMTRTMRRASILLVIGLTLISIGQLTRGQGIGWRCYGAAYTAACPPTSCTRSAPGEIDCYGNTYTINAWDSIGALNGQCYREWYYPWCSYDFNCPMRFYNAPPFPATCAVENRMCVMNVLLPGC